MKSMILDKKVMKKVEFFMLKSMIFFPIGRWEKMINFPIKFIFFSANNWNDIQANNWNDVQANNWNDVQANNWNDFDLAIGTILTRTIGNSSCQVILT